MASETHQAIETVFRIERARLVGGLVRMVRDVGLAEELAQDALVIALSENRARWDQLLIRRGLAALDRALARNAAAGPYTLQAALAACHARARKAEETDWARIAALYDALREVMPSPVVDLNRAVAHSMASVPQPA